VFSKVDTLAVFMAWFLPTPPLRKVHRPGVRLRFVAKCPVVSRVSSRAGRAPMGVIVVALAEVMGSFLPDARENMK
jgi:hypothetical protein